METSVPYHNKACFQPYTYNNVNTEVDICGIAASMIDGLDVPYPSGLANIWWTTVSKQHNWILLPSSTRLTFLWLGGVGQCPAWWRGCVPDTLWNTTAKRKQNTDSQKRGQVVCKVFQRHRQVRCNYLNVKKIITCKNLSATRGPTAKQNGRLQSAEETLDGRQNVRNYIIRKKKTKLIF